MSPVICTVNRKKGPPISLGASFPVTPVISTDYANSVWGPTVSYVNGLYATCVRGNLLISGAYPQIGVGVAGNLGDLQLAYPQDMTTLRGGYNPNRVYQTVMVYTASKYVAYTARVTSTGTTGTDIFRMESTSPATNTWTNSVVAATTGSNTEHFTGVDVKYDGTNWIMAGIRWSNSATVNTLYLYSSASAYGPWTQIASHSMTGAVPAGYTLGLCMLDASTQEVWFGTGVNEAKVYKFTNKVYSTAPTLVATIGLDGGGSSYFGGVHTLGFVTGDPGYAVWTNYANQRAYAAPITRSY